MRVLADKVWEEFLAEAGKENSPIQPLVNAELLIAMREQRLALRSGASTGELGSLLPPPPGLVLGRAEVLDYGKQVLGVVVRGGGQTEPGPAPPSRRVVAVHGWPGIGKNTFVAARTAPPFFTLVRFYSTVSFALDLPGVGEREGWCVCVWCTELPEFEAYRDRGIR
jgi:hypothetical protein